MEKGASLSHVLLELTRIGLGTLFIYAGVLKVVEPSQLLLDIEGYRLVPYTFAVLASLYLPYLEVVAGLAIVFRRAYPGGLVIIGGLMAIYTMALISAWARGLNISCGCFGKSLPINDYRVYLLRDLLLVAITVGLYRDLLRESAIR